MKYFQGIADIGNHYEDILRQLKNKGYGHLLLRTWDIDPLTEEANLKEENDVIQYLLDCQLGFAHDETSHKPTLEAVNRTFTRQLHHLEKIQRCHAYNVNKHPSKLTRREYKACRHYLFKFSLPAWYDKLPEKILTLEEKHANRNN
jgi:hypothetical protein